MNERKVAPNNGMQRIANKWLPLMPDVILPFFP